MSCQYRPLDWTKRQIQPVTPLPGRQGSTIRCTLRVIDLDAKAHCKALSYEWGPPNHAREVELRNYYRIHTTFGTLVSAHETLSFQQYIHSCGKITLSEPRNMCNYVGRSRSCIKPILSLAVQKAPRKAVKRIKSILSGAHWTLPTRVNNYLQIWDSRARWWRQS